ncbi:hypothetical protein [Phytohabitans houttuyneae]|uniref:Pentapeptide repeat-containing protein n=1 Tax=Phytohabitans houttuyneae TaxID=1076126 RepID=A0A6V8KM78_9ACTN|nr:hypothetical protein [Phytohabitans houttuyneae]GFJ86292.1 hypothetical protein Phou_104720 [Phytohabitans houttuyneae]
MSGRRLVQLAAVGSVFTRCRFERLRVESASLGAGVMVSEYIDCSFDGSRIARMGSGFTRFVRCSFRDVDLRGWESHYLELVDCVFTGQIRSSQFWGRPEPLGARNRFAAYVRRCEQDGIEPSAEQLYLRERNEFRDNDFSGADLVDVYFRYGIDLSQQRLPTGEDYLYLPDGQAAIDRALALLTDHPPADDVRAKADRFLRSVLGREIDAGQRQLLLRAKDFQRRGAIPPYVEVAMDLLHQAVAA